MPDEPIARPALGGLIVAAALLTTACGSTHAPAPAEPAPTVDTMLAPASAAAPAVMDKPEPPRPAAERDPWTVAGFAPALVPAPSVVCALDKGTPMSSVTGRLRPGGAEAFTLHHLEMSLKLSAGDGLGSGFFEGERDQVELRGVMNLSEVRVHASRPLVMNGLFIPRSHVELTVERIDSKGLTIGLAEEKVAGLVAMSPLQAEVACSAIRVDPPGQFDDNAGLPETMSTPTGWAELTGATTVPLTRAIRAPLAARLTTDPADPTTVAVYASDAGFAQIAVRLDEGVVFGWVPSTRLKALPAKPGRGGGGIGFGTGHGSTSVTPIRCPHPVPIALEVDGERRIVAIAQPGAELERWFGEATEVTQVRLHKRTWFRLAAGAKMMVRTSDLDGCDPR